MLVALISHMITADPERRATTGKSTFCLVALVAVILWCIRPVPVRHDAPKLSAKERRREKDQRRAADNHAAAAEMHLAALERKLLATLRPNAHRRRRAV
jgi:hypothetical protein